MAQLRELRFVNEEVHVWCRHADDWWNIPERQTFPQRLHDTVCSAVVSEGSRFSAFSFCLPCCPIVWFQRKRWPGKLCVTSSCDLLIVLSTNDDRPCKWRWTFSKCLCIFSEVSLCHDGQWLVLHISLSLIGDGLLSRRHVLPSDAVFCEGHCFNACKRSHFKGLDVADKVCLYIFIVHFFIYFGNHMW